MALKPAFDKIEFGALLIRNFRFYVGWQDLIANKPFFFVESLEIVFKLIEAPNEIN